MVQLAVVGAGAWGTALANAQAHHFSSVLLWGRDPLLIKHLQEERENTRYLPGISLHPHIQATAQLEDIATADLILLVVPAQSLRDVLLQLQPFLAKHIPLVVCSKGFERATHLFLSDVVAEIYPQGPVAFLSGPSFAQDVALGHPTAITLASQKEALAQDLALRLGSSCLRLYHTTDVRGVEIGGAVKNVLAIACGMTMGLGLGPSAGAALIARGFAELSRFGRAFGARSETLMGLSGLGDLVLTCSSSQSRNFSLGVQLGKEAKFSSLPSHLTEGAYTAPVLMELARQHSVDMPICASVEAILAQRLNVKEAMEILLTRPQKAEQDLDHQYNF